MMTKIISTKKGITLIETMVAVTILTIALGGPFALAAQSLQAAGYAREEVLASRLAEESLEMVHSLRDNHSIDGNGWTDAINSSWNTLLNNCVSNACAVAVMQQQAGGAITGSNTGTIWGPSSVVPCGSPTCAGVFAADIYLNPASGVFAQYASSGAVPAGWAKQPITRRIKLTSAPVSNGIGPGTADYIVTATVTYRAGKITKTVTVNDTIRDWFPKLNGAVIQ